ncbi:MAG: alkaline phosphatase family protein [Oscillospiraceae bacterium]|jgi:predicted AlkP superfamily pyrophosphatase or phosphodiesterase|nr:alkaline phosphatase family protein [Oscillospiraceae bacterium]
MIPWKPFLRVCAVLESIVAFVVILFGVGEVKKPEIGVYTDVLDQSGFFVNTAADALPQTALHDIVLAHFNSALPAGKTVKKCVVLGFDGARADALFNSVGVAESGVQLLKAEGGVFYQMYAGGKFPYLQNTVTAPGWTTLLTGTWANTTGGHGVTENGVTKAVQPLTLFTELVEKNLVRNTAFVVSWGGHFTDDDSSYRDEVAYANSKGYAPRMVWDKQPDDAGTQAAVLALVNDYSAASPDFLFTILEYCDHEGHGTSFTNLNPKYVQAFRDADAAAYSIIQAIKARPDYDSEDWLILFTSDHGGISTWHGQQFATERQIYLGSNKVLF